MDVRYVNPPTSDEGVPVVESQRMWIRIPEALPDDPLVREAVRGVDQTIARAAALESDLGSVRGELEEVRNRTEEAQSQSSSDLGALQSEKESLLSKAATLMAHAFNDWNVVPEHSVRIYEAVKKKGLPCQIFFFSSCVVHAYIYNFISLHTRVL